MPISFAEQEIREAVERYLRRKRAKYLPFDNSHTAYVRYEIKARFEYADVEIKTCVDKIIIKMIVPVRAPEDERVKVGEFLHRVNAEEDIGNFDYNVDSGEVRYRVTVYCGKNHFEPPNYEQLDLAFTTARRMLDKYGDAIVKIMYGLAEPADVFLDVYTSNVQ